MTISPEEISEFYDEFAISSFLKSFSKVNHRLNAVMHFCDLYIPPHKNILEIGSGGGIITAHLATSASKIVGVDITEVGLRIAEEYTKNAKADTCFFLGDLTENIPDEIASQGLFDFILLADVIEHILPSKRKNLFSNLESLLSKQGKILITFPTPEYQNYLRNEDPSELQIVDEDIYLSTILAETTLLPQHFSYISLRHPNQYCHLVLARSLDFEWRPYSVGKKISDRLRSSFIHLKNYFFLRKIKSKLKTDQKSA